mgnify:CR=1 FL=1
MDCQSHVIPPPRNMECQLLTPVDTVSDNHFPLSQWDTDQEPPKRESAAGPAVHPDLLARDLLFTCIYARRIPAEEPICANKRIPRD